MICDGRGTPLKVITTAANVNDVTQTLALVDGIPPVAGRRGSPRCRPDPAFCLIAVGWPMVSFISQVWYPPSLHPVA